MASPDAMTPRSTSRGSKWALATCLTSALALCACAPLHRSQFPVLSLESEQDSALNCQNLEDELLKANALRDAIIEEHGDVLADDLVGGTASVASDPILGGLVTAATLPSRVKQHRAYREALAAAEARMIHVLKLRDARPCPKDLQQTLARLEEIDRRLAQGEMHGKDHRRERRELLDQLR